jgi:hypothetical protein
MHLDLERREHLGTALNLVPGFPLPAHEPVQQAPETPEDNSATELLIMANTENWFARHAEHCLKRILWQGSISDWSEQLHQHLDLFEQAAVGADGGPGMWITRAQMDFLNWQTRASSGTTPCQTRLFVATMFLIDMTLSWSEASDQSSSTTFAAALKSKHPSLHEASIAALRSLNIDEVLKFVGDCHEMVDLRVDNPELLRDHLKATAPTIRENILALLQSAQVTHAA